jgi:hypothetical protein
MQQDSSKRRQRVAPGIYLKNGVYSAGFADPTTGKWTMPTLKATTLTAAKHERESLLSALREGRAPSTSTLTFGACLDRYLEALDASGAREKTIRTMRGIANRHVRPTLGAKPVQKITTADVRGVLRAVAHLSGSTGTKVCRAMREAFAVALREDAIVRSPLDKLDPRELPKPGSKKKPRRLDDAELERLLTAAKTKTPGYHVLFVLLAFTGLRIREADDQMRRVRVPQRVRRQPLPGGDVDRALLHSHGERAPRVAVPLRRAPSGGEHGILVGRPDLGELVPDQGAAQERVQRLLAACVDGLHVDVGHVVVGELALDTQHSAVEVDVGPGETERLELDAATASKLAGHADPGVTMRVYADDFRKATERNAAVLARAAERGFGT